MGVAARDESHLDFLDRVVVVELYGDDPLRLQDGLVTFGSQHAFPASVEHLAMATTTYRQREMDSVQEGALLRVR